MVMRFPVRTSESERPATVRSVARRSRRAGRRHVAPGAPRGMLLLDDLLTNGDSPLYARENVYLLPERLREIEHALGPVV